MTVYVLRAEGSRLVKIGQSRNVEQRLRAIRMMSAHPVELLWQSDSSYGEELERKLHRVFHQFRSHGEWFDFGENEPVEMVVNAIHVPVSDSHRIEPSVSMYGSAGNGTLVTTYERAEVCTKDGETGFVDLGTKWFMKVRREGAVWVVVPPDFSVRNRT